MLVEVKVHSHSFSWGLVCKIQVEVDEPEAPVGFCQTGSKGAEVHVVVWEPFIKTAKTKIWLNLSFQ